MAQAPWPPGRCFASPFMPQSDTAPKAALSSGVHSKSEAPRSKTSCSLSRLSSLVTCDARFSTISRTLTARQNQHSSSAQAAPPKRRSSSPRRASSLGLFRHSKPDELRSRAEGGFLSSGPEGTLRVETKFLRNGSYWKDPGCGSHKLEMQDPFTRNIPAIHLCRRKFPISCGL